MLLSILSPGLGFLYVGKLGRGLTANLLFVLPLVGLVALFAALEFFPALPLVVLAIGWLLFTGLVIHEVWSEIDESGESYKLKGFNHWTIYSGTFLLSYVLPIAATIVFSHQAIWELDRVDTRAMYPNLKPGDTVLIKKNAYQSKTPPLSALVALRFPGTDGYRIRRVLANDVVNSLSDAPGVRLAGDTIYVGGEQLSQVPYDARLASAAGRPTPDYELWVERNHGNAYVVALRPSLMGKPSYESTDLGSGELYLLTDNRSFPDSDAHSGPGDSRQFGTVHRDEVAGKPLYIAWSTSPSTGEIRWERIGLRLQ